MSTREIIPRHMPHELLVTDLVDVNYGGPSQETVRLTAREVDWERTVRWTRVGEVAARAYSELSPNDLIDVYYAGPPERRVRQLAGEVIWDKVIRYERVVPQAPGAPAAAPGPVVAAAPAAAPDLLDAAAKHMRDRAATYDKPEGERSMARAVAAFNAATGRTLTESEGWTFMAVLKIVRDHSAPGGHPDSQEDGIAYLALAGEARRKGL